MLRRLQDDDWVEWAAAARQAVASDPDAFSSSPDELDGMTDDQWRKYTRRYCSQTSVAFVARDNDQFVGMVGVEVLGNTAVVTNLWVRPSRRRSGVDTALMQAAERWTADRSAVTAIALSVTRGRTKAVNFYQSLGYLPASDTQLEKTLELGDAGR